MQGFKRPADDADDFTPRATKAAPRSMLVKRASALVPSDQDLDAIPERGEASEPTRRAPRPLALHPVPTESDVFGSSSEDDSESGDGESGSESDPADEGDGWELPPPVQMSAAQRREARRLREASDAQVKEQFRTIDAQANDEHHEAVSRRRVAFISQNAAPNAQGRVPPARTPGEAALRKSITPPVTTDDMEKTYNGDDFFIHTRPVPGKQRREFLAELPEDERDASSCFGCDAGLLSDTRPATALLQEVVNVFHDYRSTISPENLAKRMHVTFCDVRKRHNQKVRAFYETREDAEQMATRLLPRWSLGAVYEHVQNHMIGNPDSYVVTRMNCLNELYNHIYHSGLFTIDPQRPHTMHLNQRSFNNLTRVVDMEIKVRSTLTKRMNYASTALSVRSAPDVIQPMKSISLKTKKRSLFDI